MGASSRPAARLRFRRHREGGGSQILELSFVVRENVGEKSTHVSSQNFPGQESRVKKW